MNLKQGVQPSSSANGFGRHKFQPGNRVENILKTGITNVKDGAVSECPSRDRLVYLTTCLIGHYVDVHVKNGSVYSGIFHATHADRDFGIILKMACLTKDVSYRGYKSGTDSVSKAPSKTFIIPATELVQVVAKEVPITMDGLSSELQGENRQDIMLDSYISQSRNVDIGRELEPWMPDEDAPQLPELENIFDSPWTGRSWDQFKVNESLFGVKSTFNEELYTTKLDPQMREREEEAKRIAREIEGEETYDLHLSEERGAFLDIDEETKYSSVSRGFDDSGRADEDVMFDSHDVETFGDSYAPSFARSFADVASGKSGKAVGGRVSSDEALSKDELLMEHNVIQEMHRSVSQLSDNSMAQESYGDGQGDNSITKTSSEDVQAAKSDDFLSLSDEKRDDSEMAVVSVSSMTTTSSTASTMADGKTSSSDHSEDKSSKLHVAESTNSHRLSDSSPSSTLESGAASSAASTPSLSPSSSVGSLSSEKSTLNPNAKEFRFNPKAKSFVPTQSPLRPVSPVNDASFYFPTNMHTLPHMHGMPVGVGVGPPFAGHQPVLFNPQAAAMQSSQSFFPANGPQHAQQMMLGHPRQVMYMPGHPAEMSYRGREY